MAPENIRLRLSIRRYGLPEVKLVWPCIASQDVTVAKLLALVNEVVPLEGEQWGLEDYAVELSDGKGGSFECLHYQPVAKVFKEDDQVLIRSLLTDDLKRRRLSGRHQISFDGKHLVDGIAFGRPWLRSPRDRPPVALPPRKRARITYNDDNGDENDDAEAVQRGPLLLQAPETTLDLLDYPSDDEADHEFTPETIDEIETTSDEDSDDDDGDDSSDDDDCDGDGLEAELRLLEADSAQAPAKGAAQSASTNKSSRVRFKDTSDNPPDLGTCYMMLQSAFPLTSAVKIAEELDENKLSLRKTYKSLSKTNDPALTYKAMRDRWKELERLDLEEMEVDDRSASEQPVEANSPPAKKPSRPLIEEIAEEGSHESSSDSSSASGESTSDESDDSGSSEEPDSRVTALKQIQKSRASRRKASPSRSSESTSGSDSSNSDQEPKKVAARKSPASSSSNSDSSSDDSSDSSSADSSSDEDSSSSSDDDSSSSGSESDASSIPVTTTKSTRQAAAAPAPVNPPEQAQQDLAQVLPGQGLTKTQRRNARRKEAKRAKLQQESSETPDIAGKASPDSELLARKQALLQVVSEDKTEAVAQGASAETEATSIVQADEKLATPKPASSDEGPESQDAKMASDPASESPRRMRLDRGAAQRFLFGALGLKNPKTKADEDAIRKNLMKDVRPLKNYRIEPEPEPEPARAASAAIENEDNWREKIVYRAVECCHEGIELSEPPFPFVQRWDPQQHFNSMRKRKRQSQLNEEDYNDDSQQPAGDDLEFDRSQKKKNKKTRQADQPADEVMELNYDDVPTEHLSKDEGDLPELPSDISSLPTMTFNQVKPGMIITWKELQMSKASNWQPSLIPKTAKVTSIGDGSTVHMVLAMRDRDYDERLYDENTGKRIYDRFEAPDDSDEEEAKEDDGHRDLSWAELLEPRLLQGEASTDQPAIPKKQEPVSVKAGNGTNKADSEDVAMEGLESAAAAESASIQSHQNAPHLELPELSVLKPSLSDPSRTEVSLSKQDASNSAVPEKVEQHEGLEEVADSQNDGHGSPSPEKDSGIALQADEQPETGDQSDHLRTIESSDMGSIPSGQQVHSNHSLGASLDLADDTVIPETNSSAHDITPHQSQPISHSPVPSSSSSAFPSLDEIWESTQASRSTQSPLKSSQTKSSQTKTSQTKPSRGRVDQKESDREYKEAMLRLDEGQDSDEPKSKIKAAGAKAAQQPRDKVKPSLAKNGKKAENNGVRKNPKKENQAALQKAVEISLISSDSSDPSDSSGDHSAFLRSLSARKDGKGSQNSSKGKPAKDAKSRSQTVQSGTVKAGATASQQKGRRKSGAKASK